MPRHRPLYMRWRREVAYHESCLHRTLAAHPWQHGLTPRPRVARGAVSSVTLEDFETWQRQRWNRGREAV